ncbi:interleukin-13 [Xyrichtys novacula]|uniref:Interleukin-13 n=1 Tax=Xyrichtys novacula TaxID=13765 RepID=A0AAV1FRY5_XYRNO|nr:interleukin-13 [Xyrichtys novacula]
MAPLLALAVVMLLSPSLVKSSGHTPRHNLQRIIDLAKKINESPSKDIFVEDVSRLAEGSDRCGDKFFCQVEKILEKHVKNHGHPRKRHAETEILKNLNIYINSSNVNCNKTLENVTSSEEIKKVPQLVGFLSGCAQHKILNSA